MATKVNMATVVGNATVVSNITIVIMSLWRNMANDVMGEEQAPTAQFRANVK
jgi:hypothetical protein